MEDDDHELFLRFRQWECPKHGDQGPKVFVFKDKKYCLECYNDYLMTVIPVNCLELIDKEDKFFLNKNNNLVKQYAKRQLEGQPRVDQGYIYAGSTRRKIFCITRNKISSA